MADSPFVYTGFVVIIIGVIIFLAGIIWYEVNFRTRTPQSPWVYALIIGGAILIILGGILQVFLLWRERIPT